jgi:SAM-dependent methyltransferase
MTSRSLARGLHILVEWPRVYEWLQLGLGCGTATRRLIATVLDPRDGDHLLDIGCGPASLLQYLPETVSYTGFDPNPRYIERATARYPQRGRFLVAGASDPLDLGDVFDLVLAKGVLHHLSDEEGSSLADCALRHLRPGGRLITSDPVLHAGQNPVSRALVKLDRGQHVRTPEGYRRLLESRFSSVEERLFTQRLPMPYSRIILTATKQAPSHPQRRTSRTESASRSRSAAP